MKVLTLHTMDPKSPEGRLLFAALAILTTKVYSDRTPDGVLETLHNEADRIESLDGPGTLAGQLMTAVSGQVRRERNKTFLAELQVLINQYSVDNELNTADFVLTDFIDQILDCLKSSLRSGLFNPGDTEKVFRKVMNERDRLKKGSLKNQDGCATASHPSPLISAVNNQLANEHKDKEDKLNRLKLASDLIIERARMALSPAEQAGLAGALVKIYRHYLEAKYQSF